MVSNPANERTKKRNINMIRNIKKGGKTVTFLRLEDIILCVVQVT